MLNWPPKDPDSTLDYSVDWSRFLGTNTINTVTWYVYDEDGVKTPFSSGTTVNGLTAGATTNSSSVATIRLIAGTMGVTYRIVCSIVFDSMNETERTIRLAVREL